MEMDTEEYTDLLYGPEQSLLIEGASGTGKTFFLIEKYIDLVSNRGIPASQILFLTSRHEQAEIVKNVIIRKLRRSLDETWIHSFHGFATKLLTEHGLESGSLQEFKTLDRFQELFIIRELLGMKQAELSDGFLQFGTLHGFVEALREILRWLKASMISPAEAAEAVSESAGETFVQSLIQFYTHYEEYLNERSFKSAEDIYAAIIGIMSREVPVNASVINRFRYVLIDSAEDMDIIQTACLTALFEASRPVQFLCWDPRQVITPLFEERTQTIRTYAGHFDLRPVTFTKNRRNPLLGKAALSVFCEKPQAVATAPVSLYSFRDSFQEIEFVLSLIHYLHSHNEDVSWSDFAILSRNVQSVVPIIGDCSEAAGVPVYYAGGSGLGNKKPIQLFFRLMQFFKSPAPDSFSDLIVFSERTIDLDKYHALIRKLGVRAGAFTEHFRHKARTTELSPEEQPLMDDLRAYFFTLQSLKRGFLSAPTLAESVLTVYTRLFYPVALPEQNEEWNHALACFLELVSTCDLLLKCSGREMSSEEFFLGEECARVVSHFGSSFRMPMDARLDKVHVAGMSQLKGMEFRYVFCIDMSENRFPSLKSPMSMVDEKIGTIAAALSTIKPDRHICAGGYKASDILMREKHLLYMTIGCATDAVFFSYPKSREGSEQTCSMYLEEIIPPGNRIEVSEKLKIHFPFVASWLGKKTEYPEAVTIREKSKEGEQPEQIGKVRIPADKRFSPTAIAAFLACPRQFFYANILNLEKDETEKLHVGTEVHRILEMLHRIVPSAAGVERETIAALAQRLVERMWYGYEKCKTYPETVLAKRARKGLAGAFPNALVGRFFLSQLQNMILRYVDHEYETLRKRRVIHREKKVSFTIGNYHLYGIIDRIDRDVSGNTYIVDYKTTSYNAAVTADAEKKKYINVGDSSDFTPKDFQMPIYYLASAHALGMTPHALEYCYLNYKNEFRKMTIAFSGDETRSFAVISEEEMSRIIENLFSTLEKALGGIYPPAPRDQMACQQCAFGEICQEKVYL